MRAETAYKGIGGPGKVSIEHLPNKDLNLLTFECEPIRLRKPSMVIEPCFTLICSTCYLACQGKLENA